MTVQEIREQLRYGDLKFLSVLTGYSESYVKKVLHPNPKKRDVRENEKIMKAATVLAHQRREERLKLIQSFATQ